MNTLVIAGKINSPLIDFDPSTGVLKLIGRSIPENPVKFYQPLENWITEFLGTTPNTIIFFIHLDYLNTHSTECLLILMKKLKTYMDDSGSSVKVLWNFDEDDEDMEVLGEDLESIVGLPFEYKEVEEF